MKNIILIPARGGSQGVPRKNVRLLNNRPLIEYVITTALDLSENFETYVITDDDEIEFIALRLGASVVREPKTSGKSTLDEVNLKFLNNFDTKPDPTAVILTVQPTCPFIKPGTILKALEQVLASNGSIITVTDDRHLNWTIQDGVAQKLYKERVNRQKLPPNFRESGAVIGTTINNLIKYGTRIVEPINLVEVTKEEGIDIDDFHDWAIAEYVATKKKVIIRTDASQELGMGHVYRSLAIALELSQHEIYLYTDVEKPLGSDFFEAFPFKHINQPAQDFEKFVQGHKPSIVILDILDTTKEFIVELKKNADRVVTFEDLGEGASVADLLVSDLYQNNKVQNDKQLSGIEYAVLSPSFDVLAPLESVKKDVSNILLLFGGTDPSDLTLQALSALQAINFKGHVSVVQGLGKKDRFINLESYGLKGEVLTNVQYLPKYMLQADLAISSAGRTITELVCLGIPTICLCQNEKEILHTHASQQFGVINLGLGSLQTPQTIGSHIKFLSENYELRKKMNERQVFHSRLRKNKKIIEKIITHLKLK